LRDRWYGDARDLVKWGVLLHLAREYGLSRVLQVAYLQASEFECLEVDGDSVPLPPEVIQHFRRVQNIKAIATQPRIEVVEEQFDGRPVYLRRTCASILASADPTLVFLDPDTGLAPKNPSTAHVLEDELRAIWETLRHGDVLVLYQHATNRNNEPWVQPKLAQFECALGLPAGAAKLAWGPRIARDVAFFFAARAMASKSPQPTNWS
jgi:hypothetical protein